MTRARMPLPVVEIDMAPSDPIESLKHRVRTLEYQIEIMNEQLRDLRRRTNDR